jgi:hypothetical protein
VNYGRTRTHEIDPQDVTTKAKELRGKAVAIENKFESFDKAYLEDDEE